MAWVPREAANWDPAVVWRELRYRTTEEWLDERGHPFRPYTHYNVGGNTKFWGSVLYRLRREDFDVIEHEDGISPAWAFDYDTLAPYYDRAEAMYDVHGEAGADPDGPAAWAISTSRDPARTEHGRISSPACGRWVCTRRRCRSDCCGPEKPADASSAGRATPFRAGSVRRVTRSRAASRPPSPDRTSPCARGRRRAG